MKLSSRFCVFSTFSRVYVTVITPDRETVFVPASLIGRDISQTGKIRELAAFEYEGHQFMALVYPWLPMVAFYHGGEGKRYMRCECWGQYPKHSMMRMVTEICYKNMPR